MPCVLNLALLQCTIWIGDLSCNRTSSQMNLFSRELVPIHIIQWVDSMVKNLEPTVLS